MGDGLTEKEPNQQREGGEEEEEEEEEEGPCELGGLNHGGKTGGFLSLFSVYDI